MRHITSCATMLALALAACGGGQKNAPVPVDDSHLGGGGTDPGDVGPVDVPDETPAVAQGHPKDDLIPRAVLYGNPEKTALQISPDGKWLTWTAPVNGV